MLKKYSMLYKYRTICQCAVLVILVMHVTTAPSANAKMHSGATGYLDWLNDCLQEIKADLDLISTAAQDAADRYAQGWGITVKGGAGLDKEFSGRAGGLMQYSGEHDKNVSIVVYAFGVMSSKNPDVESGLQAELEDAEQLRERGDLIIGLASVSQLKRMGIHDKATKICHYLIDNHATTADGLFTDEDGRAIVPTMTTANAIVLWTWFSEFFAACTRLEHVPPILASNFMEGARERRIQYKGKRFHDDLRVPPVPAGVLGQQYLDAIRDHLGDIKRDTMPALLDSGRSAADTIRLGGEVFIAAYGHYPTHHHGGQLMADPGLFRRLNVRNTNFDGAPTPGTKDQVIVVGYCWAPSEKEYWGRYDLLRAGDRGVIWVITDYDTVPSDIGPEDHLINQTWSPGDAVVHVEGYDILISPPSGVLSEALMWMLTAQVYEDLRNQ